MTREELRRLKAEVESLREEVRRLRSQKETDDIQIRDQALVIDDLWPSTDPDYVHPIPTPAYEPWFPVGPLGMSREEA